MRSSALLLIALSGCSAAESPIPDRATQLMETFESAHLPSDLALLCQAGTTSRNPRILAYVNVQMAVFPNSLEEKRAALSWLDQRIETTKAVMLHIAALRAEPKDMRLYFECISMFAERWIDEEWRSRIIRNGAASQRDNALDIQSRVRSGAFDCRSDEGSLAALRQLQVLCILKDLSDRYELNSRMDKETRDSFEIADSHTPINRSGFTPPRWLGD